MVDPTTLLITHRLSAVKHADRLVMLDEGRIVEDGPQASWWPPAVSTPASSSDGLPNRRR